MMWTLQCRRDTRSKSGRTHSDRQENKPVRMIRIMEAAAASPLLCVREFENSVKSRKPGRLYALADGYRVAKMR